ncbi:MAG: ribosomal subunit interface protein [Deltaproteobacteria bacterium RIFCSPHIGHO2_12_FULL_43_9]|nr:MAG: ribosomal subunit interface protein [Deltaproteobacteria bacterium RIFCSPHIGHO2_12_FULL_43_9]
MIINITFRHTEPSDSLKKQITASIENISIHALKPVNADVVFSVEKYRNSVEITLNDINKTFHAEAESNNMNTAVDMVVAKLEKQLVRHKGKIKNKKTYEKSREGLMKSATSLHDEEHLSKETKKHRKPGW